MHGQLVARWQTFAVIFCAAVLGSPLVCEAGGGPENVLLVVNANSEASKTVANHYIDVRKIPSTNVLHLNFPVGKVTIPSNLFRKRILEPIFKEIESRNLAKQIDCVAYSCDFPWRVDFKKEYAAEQLGRPFTPMCSLTSATYLYAFVLQQRKEMFGLNANFYCGPPNDLVVVSRAFRSGYRWSLGGRRAGQEGLPYMLSAMLGVNSVPGNTVDEIAWYLQRAASADATAPKGTIYFAVNKTIRSKVRDSGFPAAVRLIQLAGVRAEIIQAFFPQGKQDVAGVTSGHSNVNPAGSGSRLLPGAFCDNLTSSGGQFLPDKGQTCLSEFLRMGAAGANGTVVEPTAIPQKFPNSTFHVHYVHGCSLAESFYQSVAGPFQQILVGDPLCQPWAKIPKVTVSGLPDSGFVKAQVEIVPSSKAPQGIASFQLFVDGVAQQQILPGERFQLDTTKIADGYHEVRVVAVDNTPMETQGRWIGSIVVKNGRDAIQLSVAAGTANSSLLNLNVAATKPSATSILCQGVEVAKLPSGEGSVAVDKKKLGAGPVTLIAIAEGEPSLRSQPLRVVISSSP
ncbi:MAG: hypothetical protein SH868_07875 [Bythopirellula sp.]|nr:hypothetical protein [Bythopirellula sp.]